MGRGAVEFVVIGFAGREVDPQVTAGLREQVDKATIRIIDVLFLQKDSQGHVRSFELDELARDPDHAAFDGIGPTVDGLIAPDDVIEISEDLDPGASALIVLFEHVGLREVQAAIAAGGGRVMFADRIPAEVLTAVANASARSGRPMT